MTSSETIREHTAMTLLECTLDKGAFDLSTAVYDRQLSVRTSGPNTITTS
jgi:hypothetical protein